MEKPRTQDFGSAGERIAFKLSGPVSPPLSSVLGHRGLLPRHRMKIVKQILGIGKKQVLRRQPGPGLWEKAGRLAAVQPVGRRTGEGSRVSA